MARTLSITVNIPDFDHDHPSEAEDALSDEILGSIHAIRTKYENLYGTLVPVTYREDN